MSKGKYSLPDCLRRLCTQQEYTRWLHRKAAAHVRRDKKKRGAGNITVSKYKVAIHKAVCSGGDRDHYTGIPLDWSLISKYKNEDSKEGKGKYKKLLAHLPSVDHTFDEQGNPKFVICSWLVNDSKSDLTLTEFYTLCESVLQHRDKSKTET